MSNLVERQIQETRTSHEAMAVKISETITTSLHDPMENIRGLVNRGEHGAGNSRSKCTE